MDSFGRAHNLYTNNAVKFLLEDTNIVFEFLSVILQQKLHQVVSNGPIGGKPPVGPPPSYSGTVMAQTQRNVGASVGRVPTQYAGLLPMARPANIQVSG